ncbi:MAG: pyridoxal-phosphate dependent enzyme [Flammeovirgaceae bacterium]
MLIDHTPQTQDIKEAAQRIAPYIHRTPVLSSKSINQMTGAEVYFKCENFQKCGAFKMRGASNTVFSIPKDLLKNGVATHSSGNHAAAIALAAQFAGTKAYIVMPKNSTEVKIKAVRGYGAEIIFSENTQQSRESTLQEVVRKTGAYFIHPYDNYAVIAGQATAALELIEEHPDLEHIITPVGGGGLLSGTALTAHYFAPNTHVWAGEPEGANDALLSMKKGEILPNQSVDTICDGLRTTVGEKTFPIIKTLVKGIISVSDAEVIEAMRLIWERMKIVVEPSCTVTLAAVLKAKEQFEGKKIGIILSGGNVDLKKLPF